VEKKSLINTLKSTKKPNVISSPAKNQGGTTRKAVVNNKKQVTKFRYL
jgi:hypothetical protein